MQAMDELSDINLPSEFRINSLKKNNAGETNSVFFCTGEFYGRSLSVYIKVNKDRTLRLLNEQAVLNELKESTIPTPEVIWYGNKKNETLVVKALAGVMVWNFIDPRRDQYDKVRALEYLRKYGECLAQIHSLGVTWPQQKRPSLYGFVGEENVRDAQFECLVAWIQANNKVVTEPVFVHGDFNTASVLFHDNSVSGVIDWEFAGSGWREYDLAWLLRARSHFLNTQAERDAVLDGYRIYSTYNETSLKWCEVLNYLHFGYWCQKSDPAYTSFALQQAMNTAGLLVAPQ